MRDEMDAAVVVPWFSMAEWKEVREQIHSHDRHLQRRGYERLLVWKARCPTLPAGVECTLGLMQVHLWGLEVFPQISSGHLPAYSEQDLRLMYATGIMRFLNHIAGVAQWGSLYRMATNLNIPPWIVNIRHSVAHEMTVPPLSVIRMALQFCFSWINENYWKYETDVTKNYVALEDFDSSDNKKVVTKLLHLIELWQALKLYEQVGFDDMKSIPYEKLRSDICNFMEGTDAPGSPSIDPSAEKEMDNQTTKHVLGLMKTKITEFFFKNKNIFNDDESLTTMLLEGETFLLSESLISSLNIDETDVEVNLPIKLCVLWEELLRLLQDVNLLPSLLVKLIVLSGEKGETPHRRKIAAIWAREICRGVAKANEMVVVKETIKREWTSKNKLSFESLLGKFNLRTEFEKYHPDLATAISLRALNLPIVDHELVKLAMNEPSTYTKIFLPSLLKLAKPAFSKTCQANLLRVLDIYTASDAGFQPKATDPFTPFTVESLKALMGDQEKEYLSDDEMQQSESVQPESADSEGQETWTRCEDFHEWEMCPIGVLPWQRHLQLVEFSLPQGTVWTAKQTEPAAEETVPEQRGLRAKKTDWDDPYFKKHSGKFRGEITMPSKK